MAIRQYVGARYVPKFFTDEHGSSEHRKDLPYEALTVVMHLGNSYTSKKPVPVGVEITDTNYWALTGNYNALVNECIERTEKVENDIEALFKVVTPDMYGAVGDGVTDDSDAFRTMFSEKHVVFIPEKTYYLGSVIDLPYGEYEISGLGDNSVIKCPNGFINLTTPNASNTLVMNNLILLGENKTGDCITGGFLNSIFTNVKFRYFNKCFNITGWCWVNSFNNCSFRYSNYAIYTDQACNTLDLLSTEIIANTNGLYLVGGCENITIVGGTHSESSNVLYTLARCVNFTSTGVYFENNTHIFKFVVGFYDGSYTLRNCWIAGSETLGYLALVPTVSYNIAKNRQSHLLLDGCSFNNNSAKPIAFIRNSDSDTYSYLVVDLNKNRYPTVIAEYCDLFDRTNAPTYLGVDSRIALDSDLVYHKENKFAIEQHNIGVNGAWGTGQMKYTFTGKIEVNEALPSGVDHYDYTVNAPMTFYGYDAGMVATVIYNDGTSHLVDCYISSSVMRFNGITPTKPIKDIMLNFSTIL